MLPATHWIEKDGSFTNSGRWAQWKEQVLPPEGESRHDHWILAELFLRVRELYRQQGGKFPDPVLDLTMPYKDPRQARARRDRPGDQRARTSRPASGWRPSLALKDDGTTTAGDWIYTGHYPESGNLTKRRDGVQDPERNDPTGMGFYPDWAWSLAGQPPRALQPRLGRPAGPAVGPAAARDPVGRGPEAVGRRRARLPGRPPTPADPASPLPFIMTGEGTGRLFSNGVADGPFPEHYEPIESPIDNPLHPDGVGDAGGVPLRRGGRPAQPVRHRRPTTRTSPRSYRLTEHEHYVTQHVEQLVQLQPEAFVEIPAELAAREGHRHRRPGPGLLQARQARGPGGGDEAARAAARSTARRSTRSASRSTGASSASTPGSTGWPTR